MAKKAKLPKGVKNRAMWESLVEEYGRKAGTDTYFAMEEQGKVYPTGSKNKSKPALPPPRPRRKTKNAKVTKRRTTKRRKR